MRFPLNLTFATQKLTQTRVVTVVPTLDGELPPPAAPMSCALLSTMSRWLDGNPKGPQGGPI